ncbi:polymer-forming cytoskeletal [Oxobacter pfennigii]|uniref:Polymer-forming cytoskeletal n=1 Tax=Oxobacter pfennigii TaxID=36849 RepID=A0A0P8W579_9CLOT|nr:polymer-forming cytoskeletal protein [Oxobacter pfennigii]KPU43047.1 polymer-forming cytoskeletal [Oxobacter pfennigii]
MSNTYSPRTRKLHAAWVNLFSGRSKATKISEQEISQPTSLSKEETINISKVTDPNTESSLTMTQNTDSHEYTVISVDTEIYGSITSRADIIIMGIVKGNITSDENVIISGTVEGDIIGESIVVQNGSITGNVTSKTTVIVSENSMIDGDIKCDKFSLNGNIKGDIQAYSSAILGNIAVIQGNLTAQYLSIQEGAIVNGAIKVSRDEEPTMEDMFQNGLKKPVVFV